MTGRGSGTVVLQSHTAPLPAPWYARCIASVRAWAAHHGHDYVWIGDELFDAVSASLREKTADRPAVAADLGRLHALERALAGGHRRAVWVDADVIVLDAERLVVPEIGHAFGREVWIEPQRERYRVYGRIHNAFMSFATGDPVLGFYRLAATRILERHGGPIAPQLIGPKLLAALHNLLDFPVVETAGMLCPAVIADLLAGPAGRSDALALFRSRSIEPPAALNVCGSLVASGVLADGDVAAVIELLASNPALLART